MIGMFVPLGKLLGKSIRRAGMENQIEASMVCEEFSKIAGQIFSKPILKRIKPLYVKNRILTIAVLNSVLASELQFKQQEIIEQINRKFKKTVVTRLRFLV